MPERVRRFLRNYALSVVFLAALAGACLSCEEGLDTHDWEFQNTTDLRLRITPLYTKHGQPRVVPKLGWKWTEFLIAPGSSRSIGLETGDAPFTRVLVEAEGKPAWTLPVGSPPVVLHEGGPQAGPAELAAKSNLAVRALRVCALIGLLPLLWTLPSLVASWLATRSTSTRREKT
jgi:hypothetical protein